MNSTTDAVDASPGNGTCATSGGVCTVRAAVQEANALAGTDTIIIPAGTFTLSITGTSENSSATGDLDIISGSTVIIEGAGAGVTIMNGNSVDRVFDVRLGGNATLRDMTVTGGNDGGVLGGGIENLATLLIERLAITGNNSGVGGGIAHGGGSGSSLTIRDTVISGNTARQEGGLRMGTGTAVLTNVTISDNFADTTSIGGFVVNGVADVTLINSTVAFNTAFNAAGVQNISVGSSASLTLRNTLVVTAGTVNCSVSGTFVNDGGNFAAGAACSSIAATAAVATNLGALTVNAPGLTATHALLTGNPAITGGVTAFCPSADQRGSARITPCDSGAYQFNVPPSFTTQPAAQSILAGTSTTFPVVASGNPTPTYQWQSSSDGVVFANLTNTAPYSGVATATLTVTAAPLSVSGTFLRAVASNSFGTVNSTSAILTVSLTASAPLITTQPVAQTIAESAITTFTVAASGTPTPTYQWQSSTDGIVFTNLGNTAPFGGVATATLTVTSASLSLTGVLLRAVATNSGGSASSTSVTLTVTAGPTFTTQPIEQTITAGSGTTLTVAATGNPTPTYQWQSSTDGVTFANLTDTAPFSGVTTATLRVTAAPLSLTGIQLRAVATSSGGSATSGAVSLFVITAPIPPPAPPAPTAFPPSVSAIANVRVVPGGTVSLSFVVSGAIPAEQLSVGVMAYDATLLPRSAFTLTRGTGGNWTLQIAAPPIRTGVTMVQIWVEDGYQGGGTAFLAAVAEPLPTPTAPTVVPALTRLENQYLVPGSTIRVGFVVSGGIPVDQLLVSASADDASLLPASALALVRSGGGAWTLTLTAGSRLGVAAVQVTVNDGFQQTSRTFTVTIDPGPSELVATPSGSGVALTWRPPAAGATRYVITTGTRPDSSTLPVLLTIDALTSFVLPTMRPGTYYFRVYAITHDVLTAPSNEAVAAVVGDPLATDPPTGALVTVAGQDLTLRWTAPAGPQPSSFLVEIGLGIARVDVTAVTSETTILLRGADAGRYALRVRSVKGGTVSAPSNEVSIPVGAAPCTEPPRPPILLPGSTTDAVVTESWLARDDTAERYRLDIRAESGPTGAVTTGGAGTSATVRMPFTDWYWGRVTALNNCGESTPSPELRGFIASTP